MKALVHNKPHKRCTYGKHCKKTFVLGTSTEDSVLEILVDRNLSYLNLGSRVLEA
jgi:hypothetical protein